MPLRLHAAAKAIKRYIRLMTVRIDWNVTLQSAEADDDEADADKPLNKCELVWSGVAGKRAYSSFRFDECLTASSARKLMHTHGLAHYWDMVVNAKDGEAAVGAAGTAVLDDATAVAGIEKLLAAPQGDMDMDG